jgi:aminopeptidase-like protein
MYYIVHGVGNTNDIAYKIYQVKVNGNVVIIEKPIAGVYFSLQKGREIDFVEDLLFDTYEEAYEWVVKDALILTLKGHKIHDYKILAKRLAKGNMK